MKIINKTPVSTIPFYYDWSEGLLFNINENGENELLIPYERPLGNTIPELYIRKISEDRDYETWYTEIENYGYMLFPSETEILDTVFPNTSDYVKYLKLYEDKLWEILNVNNSLAKYAIRCIIDNDSESDTDEDSNGESEYEPSDNDDSDCETDSCTSENQEIYSEIENSYINVKDYKVTISSTRLYTCSCPDFKYRKKIPCIKQNGCKHIKSIP